MNSRAILLCCCLLTANTVRGQGFVFPDDSGAHSSSDAWADGQGNSQASSSADAYSGRGGVRRPEFERPGFQGGFQGVPGPSGGLQEYRGEYPGEGYDRGYKPFDRYPGYQGGNPEPFRGGSTANAVSGSQSASGDGGASSASSAASAGTSIVNGVPVASAAAAAAAAAASPHGGSTSSASTATAGGARPQQQQQYPSYPQYPRPQEYPQYPRPQYPRPYDRPQYPQNGNFYPGRRQPWLYRIAGDEDDETVDSLDSDSIEGRNAKDGSKAEADSDAIVFKD